MVVPYILQLIDTLLTFNVVAQNGSKYHIRTLIATFSNTSHIAKRFHAQPNFGKVLLTFHSIFVDTTKLLLYLQQFVRAN